MKGIEYIVKAFEQIGVTDAFGIPGGVLLDFMMGLEKSSEIDLHLGYHEQGAAYAAVGFSQVSNKPSIAYATHGPGALNMITPISDAYFDSVPVIFVSAHSYTQNNRSLRSERDQEIDLVPFLTPFTKCAISIENINDLKDKLSFALNHLLSSRMGPIYLDFNVSIFGADVCFDDLELSKDNNGPSIELEGVIQEASDVIFRSKRPVILVGDGVNISGCVREVLHFAEDKKLPILSSKYAQNCNSELGDIFYGYIGSHGLRHSNFILSKSDCVISLGNRLSVPFFSPSFRKIFEQARFVRVDIDSSEFTREIPNAINICNDVKQTISMLSERELVNNGRDEWLNVCRTLKECLNALDVDSTCNSLVSILSGFNGDETIVCDVGNNELKLIRAYDLASLRQKVIHSKCLKTAGCGIPKAIGAFYSTKKTVICVSGDQGFQFNIQELEVVRQKKLPIMFIVINNRSSAMLLQQEKRKGWESLIHVSKDSGYISCDLKKIALAYDLSYYMYDNTFSFDEVNLPCICEVSEDYDDISYPYLPNGEPCQNLYPFLDKALYDKLDKL